LGVELGLGDAGILIVGVVVGIVGGGIVVVVVIVVAGDDHRGGRKDQQEDREWKQLLFHRKLPFVLRNRLRKDDAFVTRFFIRPEPEFFHHVSFADRALPGDREARNPNHHRVMLALTTAFWDAYLKNNDAAKKWLDGDGPRSILEENDRWQRK